MCKLRSHRSLFPHNTQSRSLQAKALLSEFSRGGIQLSKVKEAMGKGWYPRLLLFRSVVVYVFLPFAEGKSTAYMGGGSTEDGKPEFPVHHPDPTRLYCDMETHI